MAAQYYFACEHFDLTNSQEARRYGLRQKQGESAQETIFALQRSVGLLLFSLVVGIASFTFFFYDVMMIICYYKFFHAVKEYKKLRDYIPEIGEIMNEEEEPHKAPSVPTK